MYTSKWLLAVLVSGLLISIDGLGASSESAQVDTGRQNQVTGPSANVAAQTRGLGFLSTGPAGVHGRELGLQNPDRQNHAEAMPALGNQTFQEYTAALDTNKYLAVPEAAQAIGAANALVNILDLGEIAIGGPSQVQGNNRDRNAVQAAPAGLGGGAGGNGNITVENRTTGDSAFHQWDVVALTTDPNTGKVTGAGQSLLGQTVALDPSDPNPAVAANVASVPIPQVDQVTKVTICCRIHSDCNGQGTDLEALATLVPNNANSLQQGYGGEQFNAPNSGHQGGVNAMLREIRRNSPVDVLGGWVNGVLRRFKNGVAG